MRRPFKTLGLVQGRSGWDHMARIGPAPALGLQNMFDALNIRS